MGKKVAGTCYIKVDGEQLELQGNLEFQANKVSRETLKSTGRGLQGNGRNPVHLGGLFCDG